MYNWACLTGPIKKASRRSVCIIGAAAFLSLLGLAQARSQPASSNLDVRLFRDINDSQSPLKTSLVGVIDYSVYPIVIGVPIGMTAYGLASDRDGEFESGVLMCTSEVVSYGLSTLIKDGVKRQRPNGALTGVHVNHLDTADPYSFPSGHSTGAFALATMLALRYPKPAVYIPAFAWAAMVGYGRVYLGLHYPGDVLAGALLGAGSSILVYECRANIIPLAYKVIGKKEPTNFSALVVPNQRGTLVNIVYTF